MTITEVQKDYILFSNGKKLTCQYEKEYFPDTILVDFRLIDPACLQWEFPEDLRIEPLWDQNGHRYAFTFQAVRNYDLYPDVSHPYVILSVWRKEGNPAFDQEACDRCENPRFAVLYDDELCLSWPLRYTMLRNTQFPGAEEPPFYDPEKAMTITEVTREHILFSNGKKITFYHDDTSTEYNYADFIQIDDIGRHAIYYENELIFTPVEGYGFRFGSRGGLMTFIPCYSSQNGFYYTDLDIHYDGRPALSLSGCEIDLA